MPDYIKLCTFVSYGDQSRIIAFTMTTTMYVSLFLHQALRIGEDTKATFSNGVSTGQTGATADWLQSEGFTRGPDKRTLSLNLTDSKTNARYRMSMQIHDSG